MRNLYIILLLAGLQSINAQNSTQLEALKVKIFPKYSMYFDQMSMEPNGRLTLSALDQYKLLPVDKKQSVVTDILTIWKDSLVTISYGPQRELWGKDPGNGSISLFDTWNMNKPSVVQAPVSIESRMHPWFFYVGGLVQGDTDGNLNLAVNTRAGFFLLVNRWDLAATLTAGTSGHVEATGTFYSNLGLMSRVHFPIKGLGLSPNIGGEISTSITEGFSNYGGAVVAGISWFIGIGSIDIGVSVGKQFSSMGGFTFYPGMKGRK